MPYFNYDLHAHEASAASYWERRTFLHAWWALYRDDTHWTPPLYSLLSRELDPRRNGHLARLEATLIHIDALHRTGLRRSRTDQQEIPLTSVLERPLAAAVAVIDPRRRGKTAHLVLPHFGDDDEAFDQLYYYLVEAFSTQGYHRVIGPVGLSPHLGSGLLVDSWDDWPPLYTPSNPPYVPELIERRLKPFQNGRLYHAAIPSTQIDEPSGPATIRPLEPARLAGDLLPLLVAATENPAAAFPPPDALEAAYLLRMLQPRTLFGYLAEVDGAPVGFVLLGPDTAGQLRATGGGRSLWRRALLGAETRFFGKNRVSHGRVYFGGVLTQWRGMGIGTQLWRGALTAARGRGWQTLTVGPVWSSTAAAFLEKRGALARQSYGLYEWSF